MSNNTAIFYRKARQALARLSQLAAKDAHLTLVLRLPGDTEADTVITSDPDLAAVRDAISRVLRREQSKAPADMGCMVRSPEPCPPGNDNSCEHSAPTSKPGGRVAVFDDGWRYTLRSGGEFLIREDETQVDPADLRVGDKIVFLEPYSEDWTRFTRRVRRVERIEPGDA